MSIEAILKEKLGRMLFIEVNLEKLNNIFGIKLDEEVYLPAQSHKIIEEVKHKTELNTFNVGDFIEGMFYAMGCDPFFKFSYIYEVIIKSNEEVSKKVVKKAIYDKIQKNELLDAYIMLKGLSKIEESEDVYNKLLLILDELRKKNNDFKEEEISVIEKSKTLNFPAAYLYDSVLNYDNSDYEKAKLSLDEYLILGGNLNKDFIEYKNNLDFMLNYKQGKELLYENPNEALKKLLPLLDEREDDAVLYYYIAVAYRLNENNEKAIYYLNEALSIDSEFVDVVNELGLNYACLGEYNISIEYFIRAFEASQAIEICTNIIMCYISSNNIAKAKEYLIIGKKINSEDEILAELEEKLKGEEKWS